MRSGEQLSKYEIIKRRALKTAATVAVGGAALNLAACSNVEAQSPEVTTTTTAEQTPDEIITVTPSPSPEVTPTDIPDFSNEGDGGVVETVPSTPETGAEDLEHIDTAPYRAMDPFELSILPHDERNRLYEAIAAKGTPDRQSYDEFQDEYYSTNSDLTTPGKPTVAPREPSIDSTPQEIAEYNAARIRYIAAFPEESTTDFTREQITALTFYQGVNSPAAPVWNAFFEQMPAQFTGEGAAYNKYIPIAGEAKSASPISYEGDNPSTDIVIYEPSVGKEVTNTAVYVESEFKTASGGTVKKGNWITK